MAPHQDSMIESSSHKSMNEMEYDTTALVDSSILSHDTESQVTKKTIPSKESSYRPDIDGLRTLAILPVLLFHAYPNRYPSGFIGVDIFFVISGYLISGILYREMSKNKFTYFDFYARRIRRIFPTFILVLTSTLWLGCLYFLSSKLQSMAATLCAGTLFSANLQLVSLEKGYWDADIKENPLLHLWSLGVEEQFYFIWPFLAGLIVKLDVNKALWTQLAVLFVSFNINIAFLGYHGSNKYSFYIPFCRFWQMGLGGLLAYLHFVKYSPLMSTTDGTKTRLLSFGGLVLILIGFICLDETSIFPGFWALLPTLGAAFLIAAGPSTVFNSIVLSNPVIVYIGKISYALYLWHWPLLVIAKHRYPNAEFRPNYMSPAAMLVLSFVLSIGTLYNVENPLRHNKSKFVLPSLVAGVVALCILAICIHENPDAYSYSQQALNKMISDASALATAADTPNDGLSAPTFAPVEDKNAESLSASGLHELTPTPSTTPLVPIVMQAAKTTAPATPLVFTKRAPALSVASATSTPPTTVVETSPPSTQEAVDVNQRRDKPPLSPTMKSTEPQATTGSRSATTQQPKEFPNSSRGPRLQPPSYFKVVVAEGDWNPDPGYLLLPPDSPFGSDDHAKSLNLNDASPLIIAIGDSHLDQTKPRFFKLFEDVGKDPTKFPSMVFKSHDGTPALSCSKRHPLNVDIIMRYKPKVVFHSINWPQFLRPGGSDADPLHNPPPCCTPGYTDLCTYQSPKDIVELIRVFQEQMTTFTKMGIKVFAATTNPEGPSFDPKLMLSGGSVIKVPAVSRSAYRQEHSALLDMVEKAIVASGATLIDYSDNQCWQDRCEVFNPLGDPIMKDSNHFRPGYVRDYLSVLDQVVAAAMD